MNLSMVLLENKITSWKKGCDGSVYKAVLLSFLPKKLPSWQPSKTETEGDWPKELTKEKRQYKLWKPFGKVEPIWVGHAPRLGKSPELFIHFTQTQLLFCVVCFCVRWSLISNCTNDLFCIMCPLGVLQCLPQKIYLTSLSPNSV